MPKLIKLQYRNHLNETVDVGTGGIYAGSSNLRDYKWEVTKRGNKISALSRKVTERKLPLIIAAATEAEANSIRNRLMEVTEKDVLAMQPGRIIIGDYYYRCYVTQSTKKKYNHSARHLVVELVLTTDKPVWLKETASVFSPQAATAYEYLDSPYDYAIDYAPSIAAQQLNNTGFTDSDFCLMLLGPCENPSVTINGHVYQVNASAESGEYITVDSSEKTIVLTAVDGTQTNLFNSRNKKSYIFEKIPAGVNAVLWDGSFCFIVVLLEERSEPKWT